jgi:hypothetical protein
VNHRVTKNFFLHLVSVMVQLTDVTDRFTFPTRCAIFLLSGILSRAAGIGAIAGFSLHHSGMHS